MKKIKVVMYLNHPDDKKNACTVYRNITPMKYLKKFLDVRYINKVETQIDFNPLERKITNIKIDAEAVEWADVVVFSRHYDQTSLMGCLSEVAEKMGKAVVYETDDLLHKVSENIGKHDFNNNGLRDQLRFVDYLIPRCDVVSVTTQPLVDFYTKNYRAKDARVLPNYFDPSHWRGLYIYKKLRDFWRKKIKRNKTIRIGWQGGNNHFLKNFNYLVDPLNELHQKYGAKFRFVCLSGNHPGLDMYSGGKDKRNFLEFDFEHRQGVSVDDFPRALAEMDLDIGLIVVEDNEFSRSKSNIKWMEYALLGIPAIASRCEPYLNTNAILVDNNREQWFNALEELLLNSEKRDKIGIEARGMVLDFNIKNHAWKWLKAYQDALASRLDKKVGNLEEDIKN